MTLEFLSGRMSCPACHVVLQAEGELLACPSCAMRYPLSKGRPVLLRQDNNVFPIDAYMAHQDSGPGRRSLVSRLAPDNGINLAKDRVLGKLRDLLDQRGPCAILVVGGGRQRHWLSPLMQAKQPHILIYTDIDAGADVEIFCDGHDLPFADGVFDAVITTAVLEHVLDPDRVAGEIGRVTKVGGLLYSELPFMQQVHEGAYDFTRYTLSGHRRLFRQFQALDSGLVAGPATALVWAIEAFAMGFFRRHKLRSAAMLGARLCFFWLKYFDRMMDGHPTAMDGASCTYILGSRAQQPISDAEIVAGYVGAINVRHV